MAMSFDQIGDPEVPAEMKCSIALAFHLWRVLGLDMTRPKRDRSLKSPKGRALLVAARVQCATERLEIMMPCAHSKKKESQCFVSGCSASLSRSFKIIILIADHGWFSIGSQNRNSP